MNAIFAALAVSANVNSDHMLLKDSPTAEHYNFVFPSFVQCGRHLNTIEEG